jgi:hypothetical protein
MMEATVTEPTAVTVSVDSISHAGEYFLIESSVWPNGKVPGVEIANETSLRAPGVFVVEPPTGEADQYTQRPHLVHVPEKGELPRDLENVSGIWIVSEALKQVFQKVDAAAFAFVECDFTLSDGNPGPKYYFCNVLRVLDALDEPSSRVKIKTDHNFITGEDEPFYSIVGGASLVFDKARVGNSHIFRQARSPIDPICDRVMYDALIGARLDGIQLRDASAL